MEKGMLWIATWYQRIERWLQYPVYREFVKQDGWVIADLRRQKYRR